MAGGLSSALQRLRQGAGGLSDGQLLGHFVATRDEAAFAALVRRHGPMVLGVCRRVLHDFHHAEDAFQATFLVLARKAASLPPTDSLGGWLHGVAYHTAMRAGAAVGRRRAREKPMDDVPHPEVAPAEARDWLPLLDREISLLPEKYRAAIVLCDLEGRSRGEAARRLGIAEGTLSSRLARGRTLLAKRLARRGVAPAGGALAAAMSQGAAPARVPAPLVVSTAKAAALVAAGHMAGVSTPAVVLMRGTMKAMFLTRLKTATAVGLLAACATVAVTGWLVRPEAAARQPGRILPPGGSPAPGNASPAAPSEIRGAVPPVPKATEPAWKAEFRKAYGLRDGEILRRVAPPYPGCRVEYFRDRTREAYRRSKIDPPEAALNKDYSDFFTKLGWKDRWTVERLTVHNTPIKPDVGGTLGQLIHMTTGFGPTRTEGDAELLDRKVTGDFVVRAGADPEKVAAALEKLLRKECGLPVSLAVREVERDVFALLGKYEAKPLAGRKKNQIEAYGFELTDRTTGGGGSGTLREMADHVESFIETRIAVGEVTGAPKQVEWHFNFRSPFTDEERAQDRDAEAVMKNIAAQTGLTVKRERQKIKTLAVKKAE
jgi:RNA polymerase sigma factor (sigma-70 family)